ncbi:hypothetical protein ARMSODRAFT_974743 [Armillaria solidipes]|uniref:Uncharacterized protein n=1 Tax=Armillaria solidipes TaxID=1076256 RepID=A0A2H3BTF3_9AGAR|nr:hypothetical protein ARMSODRAFT_974743 [Armillaria solidipes]
MVYNASTNSSCCPAAHTISLSISVRNKLDEVDRLALLASTACQVPRVSKRPFDDLCAEMVPLLIAALPLTSWYKDVDLVSSSSGSVGSDNEDDVNDFGSGRYSKTEQLRYESKDPSPSQRRKATRACPTKRKVSQITNPAKTSPRSEGPKDS